MKTRLLSLKPLPARRSALAWIVALASAAVIALTGIGSDFEQRMQNLRAGMIERPASGEILIVEIDGQSLQALDSWPWPRSYYAAAVNRLSEAGVSQIAFDVDFSSASMPRQDKAFAAAIENSQATVILPTFRQRDANVEAGFVESEPLDILRRNAFIASVNIHPDSNGQLNQYSFGTRTGGLARPSLASMLAERSGTIGEEFAIDQSIDPATIPRLSFSDLLSAGPLPDFLAGKKVLIGATAIELGDSYSLRRFGVVPGVVIQALAAETLIQKRDIRNLGNILPLAAALCLMAVLMRIFPSTGRKSGVAAIAGGIALGLFGIVLLLEYLALATFTNVPAYCFLLIFTAFQKFSSKVGELETSQMSNEASGLPNESAMQQFIEEHGPHNIVAARMADFTDLLVLTDRESRRDLFGNLSARLSFLARDERIFHLDANTIGWLVKEDYQDDIPGHFQTATALFQAPFMAGAKRVKIGAIFGISNASVDQAKVAAQQADVLGHRWAWDDERAASAIGLKQVLLVDLDEAIENEHLHVVYQPKWNLIQDRLYGFEALIRWNHPEHGWIMPDVFIPVIEKSGRIDSLTLFVIGHALSDLAKWSRRRPGLSCAVNISARLLGDCAFVQKAIDLVEHSELRNEQITFEVTETATLDDPELSILALGRIREAGIKISIDDYGTGQSTMSYLQRLPVDEIKIDQSFVKTVTSDRGNRVMVESTIEMAHALGLTVVAEGIEDADCMNLLHTLRCDVGQGWHISKPVSAGTVASRWIGDGALQSRLMA